MWYVLTCVGHKECVSPVVWSQMTDRGATDAFVTVLGKMENTGFARDSNITFKLPTPSVRR